MEAAIRLAVAGDEGTLAELNAFVHELHVAQNPAHFKPADRQEVAAWFRSLIEKPTVSIWLAEQDGVAAGYVSALVYERPETPFSRARKWLEIDQIGVRAECRRNGIARRLVERVVQSAREKGIRDVELTSWCFNENAQAAFRRLGFVPKYVRFTRPS